MRRDASVCDTVSLTGATTLNQRFSDEGIGRHGEKTDLVGYEVAETIQYEDTKEFGRKVIAPFFVGQFVFLE